MLICSLLKILCHREESRKPVGTETGYTVSPRTMELRSGLRQPEKSCCNLYLPWMLSLELNQYPKSEAATEGCWTSIRITSWHLARMLSHCTVTRGSLLNWETLLSGWKIFKPELAGAEKVLAAVDPGFLNVNLLWSAQISRVTYGQTKTSWLPWYTTIHG